MPAPDVVVVGAGFAGLSAAVRLVNQGARVVVVEERRRLGGRATAFQDAATGEMVDNGQHALFGCYHETFAFLRDIGADGDVRLDERLELEVVDRAGHRSRLRSSSLPAPLHLVAGLMRWSALGMADRIAALRLGRVLSSLRPGANGLSAPGVADAAGRTVDEWLTARGQTPRLKEVLWEPLAVAALNQSASVASAAPFVEVLSRMFGGSRRDAAIGLPIKPLDQFYAEPARRWLESRGHRLIAGSAARLRANGDRVAGVDAAGERLDAGAVISTVPWFAFGQLAGDVPALESIARSAAAMASSPIVTVNLWLDRTVTGAPFLGLPGRTFQFVFDKAQLFRETSSHLSLVSSGADGIVAMTNDELTALAFRELSAALPDAAVATVKRATVVREKRATFSLAPGQPARPGVATPVEGFYLAGDWTDTGLPATIEGAVVSGHRAAAQVTR